MTPQGIGVRNEKSLHAALKAWYARPGDEYEVKVDGFIIDLVRGDLMIEVQTRNLSAIRRKLRQLVASHRVRLVYPVAAQKRIVRVTPRGKVIGRRKSPKVGRVSDVFDELVSLPELINHPHFSLEVALVEIEEIRREDGRGSWRRRGQSIQDRKLVRVVESVLLETKEDFAGFLPEHLPQPFSNKILAEQLGCPVHRAQKLTYCLRKMGVIREVAKVRNALRFESVRGNE